MGNRRVLTVRIEALAAHVSRTEVEGTTWDDPYGAARYVAIIRSR